MFLTRDAQVESVRRVGKQGDYLKMQIVQQCKHWETIAFGQAYKCAAAAVNMDLVYTVELNDWNQRQSLQLNRLHFSTFS